MILCNTSTVFTQNNITGGQLTWECQGNGQYVFNVEFSAECLSVTTVPVVNEIKVWNHTTLTSIPISFISERDITPSCNQVTGSPLERNCNNLSIGSQKVYFYQSSPISINGVPPTQGYQFTCSLEERSLLASNIQHISPSGITLHAEMYSYNGLPADPCYDSSPGFNRDDFILLCTEMDQKIKVMILEIDHDKDILQIDVFA